MDQASHTKIVSFLWGIADDVLRDLFRRGKYPDVILPMCVLRRFDAVLEPTKQNVLDTKKMLDDAGITEQRPGLCAASGQAFYNTSPYMLKDLRSRTTAQQLRADFEAYLDGFSGNVQDILKNFKFRNHLETLSDANSLGPLIEKFLAPEMNLSPHPVLHGDGSVKHPGMDNHSMGTVFEELVRKFNEDNNEEAGEHWTPRDAVKLMARLIFEPVADQIESGSYTLYDGAAGTGGMLTVAEETLSEIAAARGRQVNTYLYGQEINPETYAVCKADMLLKGEGENADHIVGGAEHSTLSHDAFPAKEFDFMLSNPPYGKSWKKDLDEMGGKDKMLDPRFKVTHGADAAGTGGEELSLVTRSSDGQLLFLANLVSKMNNTSRLGSRIAEPVPGKEGKTAHEPFHSYTMKQAIEEGFIEDVLRSYTPVNSWYKLVKRAEDDPTVEIDRTRKKLRKYVESHEHPVRMKTEIMVDHFHDEVVAKGKISGQARAMVVCGSIERAIQYHFAFKAYLTERKSPYRAIVAFSGDPEYPKGSGNKVSEGTLNGFASGKIPDTLQEDPYRFLICANKFQTGYDEPLLHTMYVDKVLAGVQAVQTLSRLNRAHPQKTDVFVLDFVNNADTIKAAFDPYYRTTILSEETDPNKLHDLKRQLDEAGVYSSEQEEAFVMLFLEGADRDKLDPILDACVATYLALADEKKQAAFKGQAKSFVRTYDFLASVLTYKDAGWERLSILLTLLVPKLPTPEEEELSEDILKMIDMDSYQVQKRKAMAVALQDEDAEIGPVPIGPGGGGRDPELDRLSNILKTFNDQFGTLFTDADRVVKRIREDIVPKVAADAAYQNARNNTPDSARIELDAALMRVINPLLRDDTEFYKQFVQNESFKRFVTETVRALSTT